MSLTPEVSTSKVSFSFISSLKLIIEKVPFPFPLRICMLTPLRITLSLEFLLVSKVTSE